MLRRSCAACVCLWIFSGGLPSEHEVTTLSLQQQGNAYSVGEEVRMHCGRHLCDPMFHLLTDIVESAGRRAQRDLY